MKVEDVVRLGNLLDLYGGLLTQKQREVLNNYLYYDEGLSEIAGTTNTTRQAVKDLTARTISKLESFETNLCLYKRLSNILDKIPNICDKYCIDENEKSAMAEELSALFKTLED